MEGLKIAAIGIVFVALLFGPAIFAMVREHNQRQLCQVNGYDGLAWWRWRNWCVYVEDYYLVGMPVEMVEEHDGR